MPHPIHKLFETAVRLFFDRMAQGKTRMKRGAFGMDLLCKRFYGLTGVFGWEGDTHAPIAFIDGSYLLRDRGNLLTDYADRSWAGLVGTYYKGRWEMFFQAVDDALAAGEKLEGERYDTLLEAMKDFEYAWWHERPGTFASKAEGDPVALVRKVFEL